MRLQCVGCHLARCFYGVSRQQNLMRSTNPLKNGTSNSGGSVFQWVGAAAIE